MADAHLRLRTWTSHPDLKCDSFFAFEQAVDYAVEHAKTVQCFFLLGDNTDINGDPPDSVSEVLRFLRTQFDRLIAEGITIRYINAQHDSTTPSWEAAVHVEPQRSNRMAFTIAGRRCYGLDFAPGDKLPALLKEIPEDTQWIFCHQVWQEFVNPLVPADASLAVFETLNLPKLQYVFTGDFHQTKRVDFKGYSVFSPGSGCLQELSEPLEKNFLIIDEDDQVHAIPLLTRQVFKWKDVATDERLANIITQLLELADNSQPMPRLWPELQKPIVSVKFSPDLEDAKQRLESALAKHYHLFVKSTPRDEETAAPVNAEQLELAANSGLQGCLRQLCSDQQSLEYRVLARSLALMTSTHLRGKDLRTKLLEEVREMRTDALCG